jgi:hypothetical protein
MAPTIAPVSSFSKKAPISVYFAALSTNILISLLDVDSFIRSPSTTCPEAGSVVGAVAGAVIGSVSMDKNFFVSSTPANKTFCTKRWRGEISSNLIAKQGIDLPGLYSSKYLFSS